MAIASVTGPTNIASGGTAVNMGSAANTVAFVWICTAPTADTVAPTIGGVNMTAVTASQNIFGNRFARWYYLIAPATGSQTVDPKNVAIFDVAKCIVLSGVDQTTPIDSSAATLAAVNSVLTLTTTVVAANCWLAGGANGDNAFNAAGGNFDNASKNVAGGAGAYSNGTVATGSQSGTLTMTSSGNVGGNIISIAPVATVVGVEPFGNILVKPTRFLRLPTIQTI